jgi:RNA polymerase sigma factor (sigma-70 family)
MGTTMTKPDLTDIAADLATNLDDAFPDYVRATADGIFSGSLRMLGDRGDAEDIMQETYARAYAALEGYSSARIKTLKVRGWTWTIAANLCRNRLRSYARKPKTSLEGFDFAGTGAGTEEQALSSIGRTLQEALLDLPFPQRAAVVMRHVLDLTYEDVSVALDRPLGTVKADIHRGLARLRLAYTEEAI